MKKILLWVGLGLLLSTCAPNNWFCNYEPTHASLDQICGISVPIDSMVYFKNTHQPIQVYRVWDETKPWTLYGRWWSFEEPQGSKEEYRKANAICPEWNELNDVATAQIKVGAYFFVGTTKSVDCKDRQYADTSVLQIFIPDPEKSLKKIETWKWE